MDGKTHRRVGAVAGAGAAGVNVGRRISAKRRRGENVDRVDVAAAVAHTVGGALGGVVGAILPDRVDPPTSPRHRSVGHSVAIAVTSSTSLTVHAPSIVEERLEPMLERQRQAVRDARGFVDTAVAALKMILGELFAGFISSLPAGYLSHLLCDAGTTMGLPVLSGG